MTNDQKLVEAMARGIAAAGSVYMEPAVARRLAHAALAAIDAAVDEHGTDCTHDWIPGYHCRLCGHIYEMDPAIDARPG